MKKRKIIKYLSIALIILILVYASLKFIFYNHGEKDAKLIETSTIDYNINPTIEVYGEDYKKQFLDELEEKAVTTHFGSVWNADDIEVIEVLKKLGIRKIRDDIRWELVQNSDGQYDFSRTDKWINSLTQNGIEIQAVLGFPTKDQLGDDYKISDEEEMNNYVEYVTETVKHYPQIKQYEIWNEPNGSYTTEEEIELYTKTFLKIREVVNEIDPEIELVAGATMTPDNDETYRRSSEKFIEEIVKKGINEAETPYSIHLYDWDRSWIWNTRYQKIISNHNELINNLGGFNKYYITETGIPAYTDSSKESQAKQLIQQMVLIEKNNIEYYSIYSLRDNQNTTSNENNFGILNYDYSPKQAYHAVKNYFENTNGAQYIGTIDLDSEIEANVYNKDGKTKIIMWTKINNKTVQIDYKNFIAKDLYGNDISNTNNKLEVSNSPIYLDDVSTNYFYQAISNTALEKYEEFENKFVTEIDEVEGLQEKIDELKRYMQDIANIENETEIIAKQRMEEHFNLGNLILEAYENESLDIEYVKLSSMLDMLNDIGNSFEDLVTVSSQTRNPDLQNTKTLIDTVELELKNNSDIEIIYPSKIIEFSKELYEKSEYINNLEEENDIKTGLIVSYDLHAKYLAEWANIFTNIYIDEYIENNPITINYSEINLTNKDVIATITASDIKVTNNDGKNTYTFTENGTFTFEYIQEAEICK